MRIYISADIEGISGVDHPEQTRPGSAAYERARLLMTEEVNAAVRGALSGGASEVWVADGHGPFRNLVFENLHPEARLIAGKPRPGGMMAGLDEHGPWDGVFFIGYHARAGSSGVMAHTISSSAFALVTVDGKAVGETYLNAAQAGDRGVAVLMASGDDCFAREAQGFLAGAQLVTVKQALANRAAAHVPLPIVRESLCQAAELAVGRRVAPFVLSGPLWIEVTTAQPVQAEAFAMVPGVRLLYPTAVGFEAQTATELCRTLSVFSLMAGAL